MLTGSVLSRRSGLPLRSVCVLRNNFGDDGLRAIVGAAVASPELSTICGLVHEQRDVPSPSNKYRDRVCKSIEMTGVYHTILKCPELGPDIYLTEQVRTLHRRQHGRDLAENLGVDPGRPGMRASTMYKM